MAAKEVRGGILHELAASDLLAALWIRLSLVFLESTPGAAVNDFGVCLFDGPTCEVRACTSYVYQKHVNKYLRCRTR